MLYVVNLFEEILHIDAAGTGMWTWALLNPRHCSLEQISWNKVAVQIFVWTLLYQSIISSVHGVTNIGKRFSYQVLLLNKYIRIVRMPAHLVVYEIPVVAVMSSDIFYTIM